MIIAAVLVVLVVLSGCAALAAVNRRDRSWLTFEGEEYRVPPEFLPLAVWVAPDVDPAWWPELRYGVRFINRMVGAQILRDPIVADPSLNFGKAIRGVIFVDGVLDGNPNTTAAFVRRKGVRPATVGASLIRLPPVKGGPFEKLTRQVILHELGHALGLAHDEDLRGSIMHPTVGGRPQEFTDADRDRLRARYTTK